MKSALPLYQNQVQTSQEKKTTDQYLANILNKILADWSQQYIKRIVHHAQGGPTPGRNSTPFWSSSRSCWPGKLLMSRGFHFICYSLSSGEIVAPNGSAPSPAETSPVPPSLGSLQHVTKSSVLLIIVRICKDPNNPSVERRPPPFQCCHMKGLFMTSGARTFSKWCSRTQMVRTQIVRTHASVHVARRCWGRPLG